MELTSKLIRCLLIQVFDSNEHFMPLVDPSLVKNHSTPIFLDVSGAQKEQ